MAKKPERGPATYNPYRGLGKVLAGRRFEVRESPESALDRARSALLANRFEPASVDIQKVLDAEGSPWSVALTRIGEAKSAWVSNTVFSVLPIPGIKPVVAPMFGLAAARRLASGHTELVVMPLPVPMSIAMEILLDTRENSAAIYFLPAIDQLQEQYKAEGRLVEVKKRFFAHPEKNAPVNRGPFKKLVKAAK